MIFHKKKDVDIFVFVCNNVINIKILNFIILLKEKFFCKINLFLCLKEIFAAMEKRIYTCATSHLDTVWNWDVEHTIYNCLYNTLYKNFDLFEKYPDYKFNFEGAYRYELFEEYYPEEFEKLKKYIEEGRWNVAGSAYENGDVNVPSPEALFRNILYGNGYFKKKFSKTSKDIFLPDCFGFGYALPSIINHANLLGFTTQKLSWGSAYGTPFDIGKWYGVNGKYCFASVKPDAYVLAYKKVREKKDNAKKLSENEKKYKLPWTFSFHGAGDQGGAPKDRSVSVLQSEINENAQNEVKVLSEKSDKIYYDLNALSETQKDRLTIWNNELVMTNHGVGSYTSRAIGKRWNRRNEELADMVERTAVAANFANGTPYPEKQFEKAWKRVISHQFHDDITGTSLQRVYKRSWNDYALSLNQFEAEYEHSLGSVADCMDTSWVKGVAVVVNNSLEYERNSLVKVQLPISSKYVSVKDGNGKEMPSQIIKENGKTVVAFTCVLPSLSYKVFDISQCDEKPCFENLLKASEDCIENEKYIVKFNENGDISSIFDKEFGKETLKAPICHQLINYNGNYSYPAWELTYKSVCQKKFETPKLVSKKILYDGPACVGTEIVQKHGNSVFKSVVSLFNGSQFADVQNEIEWYEQKTLLKERFSLAVSNETATYDLGLGAIKRKNNTEQLYEVPAQKWADITEDGFGVSVISDSKYGWDKPENNVLRMTVVHTPARNFLRESMQSLMDTGLNRYGFAIHSHAGEINSTQNSAREFNQSVGVVIVDKHSGAFGYEYSFGSIDKENVILRALKKAEETDEIVVRFNEGENKFTENVNFTLGNGIESAREIYASEETLGNAVVKDGRLVFDIEPYDVKSFALKLKPSKIKQRKINQNNVPLPENYTVFTRNSSRNTAQYNDFASLTLPLEIKPEKIFYKGVDFTLPSDKAYRCDGAKIELNGKFDKLCMLAFCEKDDCTAKFFRDGKPDTLEFFSATEPVGAWDMVGLGETAYLKDCKVAYEFTHAHNERKEDVIAKQMCVFFCEIDVKGVNVLEMPNNKDIIILSAVGVNGESEHKLAYPLYDRVEKRPFENKFTAKDNLTVKLSKLPHNAVPGVEIVRRNKDYLH